MHPVTVCLSPGSAGTKFSRHFAVQWPNAAHKWPCNSTWPKPCPCGPVVTLPPAMVLLPILGTSPAPELPALGLWLCHWVVQAVLPGLGEKDAMALELPRKKGAHPFGSSCPSCLCLDPVAAMRSLVCCPPTARAEQEPPFQLGWEQRPWELSGISGALMAGEAQLALLLCVRAGTSGGRAQAALGRIFSVRATQDPLIVGTGNATCSGCLHGFAWAWQHNLSRTGVKRGFLTGSESPAESRELWAAFEALVHLFVEHPVEELDIPRTPDQRWFEGNRGGITAWLCVGQVRMSSSTSQP